MSELEPSGIVARVVSVDATHLEIETADGQRDSVLIADVMRSRRDPSKALNVGPGDFVRVNTEQRLVFFRYPPPNNMTESDREEVMAAGFTLGPKQQTNAIGTVVRSLHGGRLFVELDGAVLDCTRAPTLTKLGFDPGDKVKVNPLTNVVFYRFRDDERPRDGQATREYFIRHNIIRPATAVVGRPAPGEPSPNVWLDAPTLRLLPGERERLEAAARNAPAFVYVPTDRKRAAE
jgi:hypothetical protein